MSFQPYKVWKPPNGKDLTISDLRFSDSLNINIDKDNFVYEQNEFIYFAINYEYLILLLIVELDLSQVLTWSRLPSFSL